MNNIENGIKYCTKRIKDSDDTLEVKIYCAIENVLFEILTKSESNSVKLQKWVQEVLEDRNCKISSKKLDEIIEISKSF